MRGKNKSACCMLGLDKERRKEICVCVIAKGKGKKKGIWVMLGTLRIRIEEY